VRGGGGRSFEKSGEGLFQCRKGGPEERKLMFMEEEEHMAP